MIQLVCSQILKRVKNHCKYFLVSTKLLGLGFIDNRNICMKNLFEDGLHINDDVKVFLANNFMYVLNTFILRNEKNL